MLQFKSPLDLLTYAEKFLEITAKLGKEKSINSGEDRPLQMLATLKKAKFQKDENWEPKVGRGFWFSQRRCAIRFTIDAFEESASKLIHDAFDDGRKIHRRNILLDSWPNCRAAGKLSAKETREISAYAQARVIAAIDESVSPSVVYLGVRKPTKDPSTGALSVKQRIDLLRKVVVSNWKPFPLQGGGAWLPKEWFEREFLLGDQRFPQVCRALIKRFGTTESEDETTSRVRLSTRQEYLELPEKAVFWFAPFCRDAESLAAQVGQTAESLQELAKQHALVLCTNIDYNAAEAGITKNAMARKVKGDHVYVLGREELTKLASMHPMVTTKYCTRLGFRYIDGDLKLLLEALGFSEEWQRVAVRNRVAHPQIGMIPKNAGVRLHLWGKPGSGATTLVYQVLRSLLGSSVVFVLGEECDSWQAMESITETVPGSKSVIVILDHLTTDRAGLLKQGLRFCDRLQKVGRSTSLYVTSHSGKKRSLKGLLGGFVEQLVRMPGKEYRHQLVNEYVRIIMPSHREHVEHSGIADSGGSLQDLARRLEHERSGVYTQKSDEWGKEAFASLRHEEQEVILLLGTLGTMGLEQVPYDLFVALAKEFCGLSEAGLNMVLTTLASEHWMTWDQQVIHCDLPLDAVFLGSMSTEGLSALGRRIIAWFATAKGLAADLAHRVLFAGGLALWASDEQEAAINAYRSGIVAAADEQREEHGISSMVFRLLMVARLERNEAAALGDDLTRAWGLCTDKESFLRKLLWGSSGVDGAGAVVQEFLLRAGVPAVLLCEVLEDEQMSFVIDPEGIMGVIARLPDAGQVETRIVGLQELGLPLFRGKPTVLKRKRAR